jgi:hypothetical protein
MASHRMRTTPDFKVGVSQSNYAGQVRTSDAMMLMIANFSEEALTLPKGTVVGIAQEISENLVIPVDDEIDGDRGHTFLAGQGKERPAKFKAYVTSKLAHLSPADQKVMESVL